MVITAHKVVRRRLRRRGGGERLDSKGTCSKVLKGTTVVGSMIPRLGSRCFVYGNLTPFLHFIQIVLDPIPLPLHVYKFICSILTNETLGRFSVKLSFIYYNLV